MSFSLILFIHTMLVVFPYDEPLNPCFFFPVINHGNIAWKRESKATCILEVVPLIEITTETCRQIIPFSLVS